MADALLGVNPDGPGKSIDMDSVATQAGSLLYRQRANLVGQSGDVLDQLLVLSRSQLAVLRAILRNQQITQSGAAAEEDDFLGSIE